MRRSFVRLCESTYLGMPRKQFILMAEKACPFIRESLGATVSHLKPGELTMRMPFKPSFVGNPVSKVLHGGVTAALMDHVGGFAAMSSIPNGKILMSTVDIRIDYINPAPPNEIICEATVTSKNKTLIRSDVICWNHDKSKCLATARALYNSYPTSIEMKERVDAEL